MKTTKITSSRLLRLGFLLIVGFILTQCEQSDNGEKVNPVSPLDVSADYAAYIAATFQNAPQSKNARVAAHNKDSLIVERTETLKDESGPVFHVLTYKNGQGWIIIAADRRLTPVLAYSYSGRFSLQQVGDGAKAWVDGVTKLTKNAKATLDKPTAYVEAQWKRFEKAGSITRPGGRVRYTECSSYEQYMHQCPANYSYTNAGYPNTLSPFGGTWKQTEGYAYSCPPIDWNNVAGPCASCGNNRLTGCGPLAIAMVMRANHVNKGSYKPSGYDFDNMSNAISNGCNSMSSGEIKLSELIGYAHDKADAFSATSTTCAISIYPSDIPTAFSAAGYSNSGSLVDFLPNQSQMRTDLNQGYPVVMSGMQCGTCVGTWHIWVCDGFQQNTYYQLDCSGSSPTCMESSYLFYHMRWGQRGNSDGWYGVGNFVMIGDVYDTNLKANIQARP